MFSSSKIFQKKNKTVYNGLKRKNKMDYQNGSIFKKNNKRVCKRKYNFLICIEESI